MVVIVVEDVKDQLDPRKGEGLSHFDTSKAVKRTNGLTSHTRHTWGNHNSTCVLYSTLSLVIRPKGDGLLAKKGNRLGQTQVVLELEYTSYCYPKSRRKG